jgi:hypothetical protein
MIPNSGELLYTQWHNAFSSIALVYYSESTSTSRIHYYYINIISAKESSRSDWGSNPRPMATPKTSMQPLIHETTLLQGVNQ